MAPQPFSPPYQRKGQHSMSGKTVVSSSYGGGGKGKGPGARGIGGPRLRRHRKVLKDNINGITKGDIRRLARRGGVKRISALIYHDVREAIKARLNEVLRDCVAIVEHSKRKTVTANDVIWALRRQGRPIYGFDNINDK
ncbi:predicted protein [Sclerotinia sclerotiorum 1980 UF-70]|uniref:Histone H4 n=2 Tax=Sclerotinia sclerotiorum (strain ATCC 18683 / 1980 / Ss-1) TaxID=665079 RepID=A7ET42_SCLS1|nr:predicted protein [Sclerotinia sclerotiorum 1980 UF-70]APA13001.1 hypothetical protein sscle_10g077710 [Sclerotinia sclerotiorum 1980 UF-70]EDN92634.1 predicted protein [Sclerotinia sclerotiorum 1980 UF-70]